MAKLRIYADTSVIGGCFDKPFAKDSLYLMELARRGRVVLLLSAVVIAELENAPEQVRSVLAKLPASAVENVPITAEVTRLRDAYLKAGIVGPKWVDDATHVAAASVAGADAIVSWNFKHIVQLDRMKAYNRVNQKHGYGELTIATPIVVAYEEENRN
jgi:hypothetical protein